MATPELKSYLIKSEDSLPTQSPSPDLPGETAKSRAAVRFEIEHIDENQVDPGDARDGPGEEGLDSTVREHTFGYHTLDAAPQTAHYRSTGDEGSEKRPSLKDLMAGGKSLNYETVASIDGEDEYVSEASYGSTFWKRCCKRNKRDKPKRAKKFGWIVGVLIRCVLNIWGVMLFLRLSWITGQAGIGLAAVIVLLSVKVTILTTLSMSAIATNGQIKGGGAYYLISRSLGPEFGGAIGIIFSLANAVAVALYVVGFAETCHELIIDSNGVLTSNMENDVRVIGTLILIVLLIITLIGLDWEAIVQIILLIIMVVSIASFIIGVLIPNWVYLRYDGFTYFSGETIVENFGPSFRDDGKSNNSNEILGNIESFFIIFGIFFPAATGILAGANISGDLKNPSKAIPKGTLLAIVICGVTYLLVSLLCGMVVVRDALEGSRIPLCDTANLTYQSVLFPASIPNECNSTYGLFNDLGRSYNVFQREICSTLRSSEFTSIATDNSTSRLTCQNGLLNNFQVVAAISLYAPIIYCGIFAATLSSALTSLVSAPKVFQRVAQDKIFPLIHFFAKEGGRSGREPIRGYFLTFVIALGFVLIGRLNDIAPIISNFFLAAYTLINYSCFQASFSKSPGWRPSFKFYNKWVALYTSLLCFVIMFIIKWWTALITIVLILALYAYVAYKKPDINWGSSGQAFWYMHAMLSLKKLDSSAGHIKNYRPHLLVLSGRPSSRPDLVTFCSQVIGNAGVLIFGDVLKNEIGSEQQSKIKALQSKWLHQQKIKAFYKSILSSQLSVGCRALFQTTGLGKLSPNTVVIGYKNDWADCPIYEVEEYVQVIQDAFECQMGVVVFRLRAGFDTTESEKSKNVSSPVTLTPRYLSNSSQKHFESQPLLGSVFEDNPPSLPRQGSGASLQRSSDQRAELYPDMEVSVFHKRPPPPVLDVMDVTETVDSYAAAIEQGEVQFDSIEERPQSVTASVDKFGVVTMPSRFSHNQGSGHIDVYWLYDDGGLCLLLPYLLLQNSKWKKCKLRIFTVNSPNHIDSATLRMTSMLHKFRIDYSTVEEIDNVGRPSQENIDKYKSTYLKSLGATISGKLHPKTLRHIRLGEILRERSSEATLIVVTMSVPQKTSSSAHQYMSWLDVMSAGLPPVMMMRGNQQSVLTFYA